MGTQIWDTAFEGLPPDTGEATSLGPNRIRTLKQYARKRMRGLLQISVTTLLSDDTSFKIEIGSVFEVNDNIIEIITADEPVTPFTITTITNGNRGYVYSTDAGVLTIAATAPTWSSTKEGWYNGILRAIATFVRDGSNYTKKRIMGRYEKLIYNADIDVPDNADFALIVAFDGNAAAPAGDYNGEDDGKVQVKEVIANLPSTGTLEIAGDEYAYTDIDPTNRALTLSGTLTKDYAEDDAVYIRTVVRNLKVDGNLKFDMIVENREDDPATPEVGRMWFRTDL